jgi:DNA-3-methyladenine glycosylase II
MMASLTQKGLAEGTVYLAARDKDLARLLDTDGIPPLWARKPGFATLIHIILEQQVSLASALAMYKRLVDNIVPFTPRRFSEVGSSYLRSLGVTRQKASYCLNLALTILDKQLDLKAVTKMKDADVLETLTRIKGIGPWTANIYLLMALGRPDIWPAGDIALENTLRKIKVLDAKPTSATLSEVAESWRPFRSVAARMLWHHYLSSDRPNASKRNKKDSREHS